MVNGDDARPSRVPALLAIGWLVGTTTLLCLAWGPRYNGMLDAASPPTILSTVLVLVMLVWAFTVPAFGLLVSIRQHRAAWTAVFVVELGLSVCCGLFSHWKLG